MPKNKSLCSERTRKVVEYCYNIAKKNNKLGEIIAVGGFTEQAIRNSMKRGTISQNMIDTLSSVLNIDKKALTGEIEYDFDNSLINTNIDDVISDQKMIKLIELIVELKDIDKSGKMKSIINEIKKLLLENTEIL